MSHLPTPGGQGPPVAYAQPVALPPGYSCLAISVGGGPYVDAGPALMTLRVGGAVVPIAGAGTWYVPVPAGRVDVRFTNPAGVPLMSTVVAAMPAQTHRLTFQFGHGLNRVYDEQGRNVTRNGTGTTYLLLVIMLGLGALLACGVSCLILRFLP